MDRIIFEVDDISAKKWNYASKEKKEQLNGAINRILKNALDRNEDDFGNF